MRKTIPKDLGIKEEMIFRAPVENGSYVMLRIPKEYADEIVQWAIEEDIPPENLISWILARAAENPRNPYSPASHLNPLEKFISSVGHAGQDQIAGRIFPIQKPVQCRRAR